MKKYYGDSYIESAKRYKKHKVNKYHIFMIMLIGSLLLTIIIATTI